MASSSGGSRINLFFQCDENVSSVRLTESTKGRGARLEMDRNNHWVVLFSVVGLAVYTSFTAMGDAEMYLLIAVSPMHKLIFILFLFASALLAISCYQEYLYKQVTVLSVNK
jgi:hypothetical protein